MLRYEIPAQEAEGYISHFMTVIIHEIERENPTVYQKHIWENGENKKKSN